MGGQYALNSGEPPAVAAAIAEQYEAVSTHGPGLALALADRLDSLVGLFRGGYGAARVQRSLRLAPRGHPADREPDGQ